LGERIDVNALEELCEIAASFHARGLAFGSTGNISVRSDGKIWVTPTGESLRALSPDRLACIDMAGKPLNDRRPSKEFPFHLAAYRAAGERASAIVHLHAPFTVGLSCLDDLSATEPMPAITPYYLMRVSPLAVLPYFRPGSQELADAVEAAAVEHDNMLLRNHGSISIGATLNEAVDRTEELEETAKLYFLLRGHKVRTLTGEERADISRVFKTRQSAGKLP
jgi:ribulose-5-phosphate 4-epimerase/fuculose-1-phosphate aldolase